MAFFFSSELLPIGCRLAVNGNHASESASNVSPNSPLEIWLPELGMGVVGLRQEPAVRGRWSFAVHSHAF